jgi:hypothetical protein
VCVWRVRTASSDHLSRGGPSAAMPPVLPRLAPLPVTVESPTAMVGGCSTPALSDAATDEDALAALMACLAVPEPNVRAEGLADLRKLILRRGQRLQLLVCKSPMLAAVLGCTKAPELVVVEAACRVLCTMYVAPPPAWGGAAARCPLPSDTRAFARLLSCWYRWLHCALPALTLSTRVRV